MVMTDVTDDQVEEREDPGEVPEPAQQEPEPEDPRTRRAVELTLALLGKDPRTKEVVELMAAAVPALAAANGVDPQQLRLGDMFQAVWDAWGRSLVEAWHEETGATSGVGVRL